MLERPIEKKCIEIGKYCEIKFVKLFTPWDIGFPDRLFLPKGGIPFFVEFKKTKDGILSKQQRRHKNELLNLNYLMYVCSSVKEFIDVLENYEHNTQKLVSLFLSERCS